MTRRSKKNRILCMLIDFKREMRVEDIAMKERVAIFLFGSATCGPCVSVKKKLQLYSKEHKDVPIYYVSTDKFQRMAAQMDIFSIPTILVYVEGKLLVRESQVFSLTEILEKVGQYL